MLLEVSDAGSEYLINLDFWDLDYERGLRATPTPSETQMEDRMILKLYDQISTTVNQDGSPTGESWEPRSETYFTDQVPDPNTRAVMQKTIRRLFEMKLLMEHGKPDPSELIDVEGPYGEIVPHKRKYYQT